MSPNMPYVLIGCVFGVFSGVYIFDPPLRRYLADQAIARGEEPNLGPSILTGRNEIDRMYMKSDKEAAKARGPPPPVRTAPPKQTAYQIYRAAGLVDEQGNRIRKEDRKEE